MVLVHAQVVFHDRVVVGAGGPQEGGAQHAGAVLPVHAVDERRRALGGQRPQGLPQKRLLAYVAAVVAHHALLGGTVLLDDAGDKALVRVLPAVLGRGLKGDGLHAHDVGLGVRGHLGAGAQVVDGGDAEGLADEGGLLAGERRKLAGAEQPRVGERPANGADARIAEGAGERQRLEGEAGDKIGGLAVLGDGAHLQQVAAGLLGRVHEAPVHAARLVHGGGGVGRPSAPVVQRELHGADGAVEVVHVAGELDGSSGEIRRLGAGRKRLAHGATPNRCALRTGCGRGGRRPARRRRNPARSS